MNQSSLTHVKSYHIYQPHLWWAEHRRGEYSLVCSQNSNSYREHQSVQPNQLGITAVCRVCEELAISTVLPSALDARGVPACTLLSSPEDEYHLPILLCAPRTMGKHTCPLVPLPMSVWITIWGWFFPLRVSTSPTWFIVQNACHPS